MDPGGEGQIFLETERIAAERMTIDVTHQLENIRLAGRILAMRDARVIEQVDTTNWPMRAACSLRSWPPSRTGRQPVSSRSQTTGHSPMTLTFPLSA